MKHFLFITILGLVAFVSDAQVNKHVLPCGGMDILDVGVHIEGHNVLDYNGIRYSEISADRLREGFTVALTDTSHRITCFLIDYDGSGRSREFSISGTKATNKNAPFIKSISPGDLLSLECINIEKFGKRSLSTSFRIVVTK